MRNPTNLKGKLLLLFGCAGILCLWLLFGLPCPLRQLTGILCPGCGMSRAWLAALRLDLGSAFLYHPMFWSIPFLILFGIYDGKIFRNDRINKLLLGGLIAGLLVCYLIRLIGFLSGNLPL